MVNNNTVWQLENAPFSERSLEEVFERGETQHDQESGYTRLSAHVYPATLRAIAFGLRGRISGGKPAVYRLTTKLGAARLRALDETQLVEDRKLSLQSEATSILDLTAAFAPQVFLIRDRILVARGQRENINLFGWVNGLLGDLSSIYDLSLSQVAAVSVIAGFASSTEWIRNDVSTGCCRELDRFRAFLTNWVHEY